MSTEREQEKRLTEAEAEAVVKAMTHGGYRCESHLIRVVSRIVAAHEAAARAEGAQAVYDALMAAVPPLNYELKYDGSEDPHAAAYVEGFKDAWQAADEALRIARSTP